MVSERVDHPTTMREDDAIVECYIRMQGVLRGLSDLLRQITARSATELVEIKQILAAELAEVKPVQTMINAGQVIRDDLLSKMDKSSVHQTQTSALRTYIPVIGENFCKGSNPDEVITYGASIQATILSDEGIENVRDRLLLEVASPPLCLQITEGVMTDQIPRSTTIPTKKEKVFSMDSDNLADELIQIYKGERTRTPHNNLLGKSELVGILPAPRGIPQINVCFTIVANNIMNVFAEDKMTTQKNQTTIETDSLYEGIDLYSTFTRAMFEELKRHLFKKCREPVERCLRDAKIDKSNVHDVVLVGRSTRTPYYSPVVLDGYPPPLRFSM